MTVKITDKMLYIVASSGATPFTLTNIDRVRRLLADVGVTDVELHPLEIEAIDELRERAAGAIRQANAIEARGPRPEPRVVLEVLPMDGAPDE